MANLFSQCQALLRQKPSVAAPAAPAAAASGTAEGASGAAVVAPWASFPKRNKTLQYKLLQDTFHVLMIADDIFTYFYIYLYIQMIPISSNTLPLPSLSATVWLLSNKIASGIPVFRVRMQFCRFYSSGLRAHITSPYFSSIAGRALTFSRLKRPNKPLANQTSGFNTFFIPFLLES